MSQEGSDYNPQFGEEVNSAVVGERNVIYNYFYYRQDSKPVEAQKTGEKSLRCPYRGLFPFQPEDAEFFFGRNVFIDKLYKATKTRNVIPVIGASGSGKSSVILAGLVPKLLQDGHRLFTYFRPQNGDDVFHALALALVPLYASKESYETDLIIEARKLANGLRQGEIPLSDIFRRIKDKNPKEQVILIGDEFEEIYIHCQDATRHQFLHELITKCNDSNSPVVLVLTMRADFMGKALADPILGHQLENFNLQIRPLNQEELAAVIKKPAYKMGVSFEQGLVQRIIEDVKEQPGNLALLEFALTKLWQKREGKQLTHQGYEAIGKVEGALAYHANEKYNSLSETNQKRARRILIQLLHPVPATQDTRRIATKLELGEDNWLLVKRLADDRLVVTNINADGEETVEVVHEALIQNWRQLQDWMEQNREFRSWQERLRSMKEQWEINNRDPGSLLRGMNLTEAEKQLQQRPQDLMAEREFILESLNQSKRESEEKSQLHSQHSVPQQGGRDYLSQSERESEEKSQPHSQHSEPEQESSPDSESEQGLTQEQLIQERKRKGTQKKRKLNIFGGILISFLVSAIVIGLLNKSPEIKEKNIKRLKDALEKNNGKKQMI